MSELRPLKRKYAGRWASQCGRFEFQNAGRIGWFVIAPGKAEPLNWCKEQKTLREAVAWAEDREYANNIALQCAIRSSAVRR